MKITKWEKAGTLKHGFIKRKWKHSSLPKTSVLITEYGPAFYEISIQQLSKREKWKELQSIPKGSTEFLKIGETKTLEEAEKKAVNWMRKHPDGRYQKKKGDKNGRKRN